ncbi:MAG: site-specific DNA-methyltransferase [Propionibacteriaceae bacterium]|nr:site-specific DNA-methyltransferase [Propionibacteriaceae bacterium]
MPEPLLPAIQTDTVTVYLGDTVAILPILDPESVDSIVTDPPYGLRFCDQTWDGAAGFRESLTNVDTSGFSDAEVFEAWCRAWAVGALHVLKPGGHLAAFGGTRTWHRLVRGVESAGFEIRDQIAWLYSTGMPKSMDISHAIDAHLGASRTDRVVEVSDHDWLLGRTRKVLNSGQPVTEQAKAMAGWGTGLRPGFEPILIAHKPPDGTLVGNVLAHGVGGLNIDTARFGDGRWPVNVALDDGQAESLDQATGSLPGGVSGKFPVFRYDAKASPSQRPRAFGMAHATVKPLSLMRWLVNLLTPVGGVVLEPFAGSGSTIQAALLDGFRVIAVEKDPDYLPLISSRLDRVRQ